MNIQIIKNTLYKGLVELHDYQVMECVNKKENAVIHFKGEVMTMSPEFLEKNVKEISKPFLSKIPTFKNPIDGGNSYRQYMYNWLSDKDKEKQLTLF